MGTLGIVILCSLPALAQPAVEAEETVYTYAPASNGAGPMWCFGSTCLARAGGRLFASGLDTIEGAKPLNNTRWTLYTRDEGGWRPVRQDEEHRTREPSPLVGFPDGRLLLSVNPTLTEPDTYNGPARPEILEFAAADPAEPPVPLLPAWSGEPAFTEHSYRSFAADGPRGEVILFQNVGYTHAEWAFLDAEGGWASGQLVWPYGAEYEKPEPIRVCYPNVVLRDRAVWFCGVSDIVEPNSAWRAYKKELTGQEWDYDFRRLFLTWCPDVTASPFAEWTEIASREATCGWISPCDLWVDVEGAAHILWQERAIDERLRERFFPGEKQRHSLEYAVVREGQVVLRRTLMEAGEGLGNEVPGQARFQVTTEGRLFVLAYVSGSDGDGQGLSENRVFEVGPDGTPTAPERVPFEHPFSSFFTATTRGGSPPSDTIDLLGESYDVPGTIRYGRVRLVGE